MNMRYLLFLSQARPDQAKPIKPLLAQSAHYYCSSAAGLGCTLPCPTDPLLAQPDQVLTTRDIEIGSTDRKLVALEHELANALRALAAEEEAVASRAGGDDM